MNMATMSSTWDDALFGTGAPMSELSTGGFLGRSLPLSSWDAPLPSISALPAAAAKALSSGPPGLIPASSSSLAGPPGLKSATTAPPPGLGGGERKMSRGEAFLNSLGNNQSDNWTT